MHIDFHLLGPEKPLEFYWIVLGNNLIRGEDEANGPEILDSICSSLFRDEGYEGGIYSLGDLSLQVKFLKSVNQITLTIS